MERARSGTHQKLQHTHHTDRRREAEPNEARLRAFEVRHLTVVAENREGAPRAPVNRKANHDSTGRAHASIMGSPAFRDKLETP